MPVNRDKEPQSEQREPLDLSRYDDELERVAYLFSADPSELSGEDAEWRQALDHYSAATDAGADAIVPQALEAGMTPQEAYDATLARFNDTSLAMKVRRRVWVEQLNRAEGGDFDRMAAEIEELSPLAVHRDNLFRALDEERERRGLSPSPSKAARDAVEEEAWRETGEQIRAEWDAMSDEEQKAMALEGVEPSFQAQRRARRADRKEVHINGRGMVAFILASPLFLIGYAFAALFFTVPIYIVVAVFGETYTILPDTRHELETAGMILAALTGWFFLRSIGKALSSPNSRRDSAHQ